MASHGYRKYSRKFSMAVPQSSLRLNSTQRQSMSVIIGHHPKLRLPTGKLLPLRTLHKSFQRYSNGKINFPPPLSDGWSDSLVINTYEWAQDRDVSVSRRIHGLVSKYLLSSGSRDSRSRISSRSQPLIGLEPIFYFPLSRKEKHVTARP
jgi:hypothetical protein